MQQGGEELRIRRKANKEKRAKGKILHCVNWRNARMAPVLGRILAGFAVKPKLSSAAETAAIQRGGGGILRKEMFLIPAK